MDVPSQFVHFGFESLVSTHLLTYNVILILVILLEKRRKNEVNKDETNNDWPFDSTDQLLRNCDVDDTADWCV